MPKIEYPPYKYVGYPKVKYHATHDPVTVESSEEEEYLDKDEWKDSPEDHGIITHPSKEQQMKTKLGFNFEELKEKKKAEKSAALKRLTAKEAQNVKEVVEETEEETEEQESEAPKKKNRR
jgi:hypothetical protein